MPSKVTAAQSLLLSLLLGGAAVRLAGAGGAALELGVGPPVRIKSNSIVGFCFYVAEKRSDGSPQKSQNLKKKKSTGAKPA